MGAMASIIQFLSIQAYKFEEAHILALVDNSANIIVSFLFQTIFFLDTPNPLKLVGAGLVLSSVIFIGGRAVWQHGKWNKK